MILWLFPIAITKFLGPSCRIKRSATDPIPKICKMYGTYEICKICVIYEKLSNMHSMHLHFTHGGHSKDLAIHLVLWLIPSAIQIVPLSKHQRNFNELAWRIKHLVQRMCPVMFNFFKHHIGQESIQKKRKEKEDVLHVNSLDPLEVIFISSKIFKDTSKVWCNSTGQSYLPRKL